MRILAIETSCDETAIAVLSARGAKNPEFTIEAHLVASQIALHAQYGGVFPMMAKREHARAILPLTLETLAQAGLVARTAKPTPLGATEKKLRLMLDREPELLERFLTEIPNIEKPDIDRIAVTVGPGLAPALWVGINFAKALSLVWGIPVVPTNHMEGHVLSVAAPDGAATFSLSDAALGLPAISLLVSGGHTEIVLAKKIGSYTLLGQTRDDAAGEAFDKVARMLELPYPGGPEISRLAAAAREHDLPKTFELPRPMLHSGDYDFSFSGLKTAVLYTLRDRAAQQLTVDEQTKTEIAREFEDAVCDVLVTKTVKAATAHGVKHIIVGGGVSANGELRARLAAAAHAAEIAVTFPTKGLSTDNAIMIGLAGYFGKPAPLASKRLIAQGNMAL